ncbi:RNA polymerase II holoenzyme cyclin-like subunit [Microbotryomycetes sp. JL201]|nr:RNA polymerase II holoenzyme cyclin-like subunit [Microbotryomycetes sp. JL201]
MAANFYLSSHANYHLHPRGQVVAARVEDLKHATEQEIAWIEIWSATGEPAAIQKICKRLGLRQQVSATAIVFFRRFYLRNSYCETDCPLVAAACCYVAAKAEETPVHVKSATGEARAVFNEMGLTSFTNDHTKIAEMEFYLIEELDFHLIVFHPYRALVQLCGRDGGRQSGGEGGRAARAAMLDMDDTALQMAWFVINDTFRTSLCLIYPPHLIAIAAIYMATSLHPPPNLFIKSSSELAVDGGSSSVIALATGPASRTRRQSIDGGGTGPSRSIPGNSNSIGGQTDAVTFLASLNVDHTIVLEIVQEIVSLYDLWNALETAPPLSNAAATATVGPTVFGAKSKTGGVGAAKNGSPAGLAGGGNADERILATLTRMRIARHQELQMDRERGKGTPSWKR